MAHGHYFEELSQESLYVTTSWGQFYSLSSQGQYYATVYPDIFEGGDFSFDLTRRKVMIQREKWSASKRRHQQQI